MEIRPLIKCSETRPQNEIGEGQLIDSDTDRT
jgi:hypothetical protein